MNLLDAATTIATTADIDTLFAIYSQSRAYANGREIRAQIESRVNGIASLNGYEDRFDSFRALVERYDNDTSPLWNLVSSDSFLVTDVNHPLPYSGLEFLQLFRRIYEKSGFIILDYEGGVEPHTKYRLLKTSDGLRFIKGGRDDKAIEGRYDEDFLRRLPLPFTEGLFGKDFGLCKFGFANDFYAIIDLYCQGTEKVYPPLTEKGFLDPISVEDSSDYAFVRTEKVFCTTFEVSDNNEVTLQHEVIEHFGYVDEDENSRGLIEEEYSSYTVPLMIMKNPLPYCFLPYGQRYAAYLLLVKATTQIIPFPIFDFYEYELPFEKGVCYDDGHELYLASYVPLNTEELELLEAEDMQVEDNGLFEEIYFYTLYRNE